MAEAKSIKSRYRKWHLIEFLGWVQNFLGLELVGGLGPMGWRVVI